MRRTALIAAVGSVFALASLSQAAFTISAAPSAQAASAGKFAFDLFAQNDAGGSDGDNLQGVAFTFTGTNDTRVFFASEDLGPDGFFVDTWNFTSAAGTTVAQSGFSNLRIGTRAQGLHAFVSTPGDAGQPATADQLENGFGAFSADYAVLSPANSVLATTAPGVRFARLVFNTANPTGTITGAAGGEVGSSQPISFTFGGVEPNADPVVTVDPLTLTIDVSPAGLESGSATVSATDSDGTVVSLALTSGALGALADNYSESGGAAGPLTISLADLTYADLGTYVLTYTATDNLGATGTGELTIQIVPEPATLGLVGLAGLGLIRRRK